MTPSDLIAARAAREQLALAVRQPEAAIDLAHAALLVAAEEEPRCDVAGYRAQLYALGMEARARLSGREGGERVVALNSYVFAELGFAGNQHDYYDVRNSLLHRVLERRTGLPITLSVVYMDIARRAGLHAEGVGLPGHFVVRVRAAEESARAALVDPFYGTLIDEDDCQQRLDTIYGGQVALTPEHLRASSARAILVRILRNLKAVYVQAGLYRRALAAAERALLVEPESPEERRDRGTLLAQLERTAEAVEDLQAYLKLAPKAPDADSVREQLKKLKIRLAMLN
ncbi:MAG TPA: transglutaminase-like domain-containing protein [Pyrinomonadaceae bacterium]|nr:transglutaminase-like domain-containing protein [Pyrinomonadaceae bacterium]